MLTRKGRTNLYDKSHEDYKNDPARARIWTQIAEALGLSAGEGPNLKKIWDNLRKLYTTKRKTSEFVTGKSGDGGVWVHLNIMRFLEPFIAEAT